MSQLTMAKTLQEAQTAVGEIRAGGTDIMDRRRHHISVGDIVDISRITGLDQIEKRDDGGYRVGAHVTIANFANHPEMITHYPGLAMAAGALATPQIRAMGTMGGVLLQTTRCWYFRHEAFNCYKKGGDSCPAREGDHRFGVVFDLGACAHPHPSTVGMVLMNYGAQVMVNETRTIGIDALYGDGTDPTRDHQLGAGEILTHIILPPPTLDERASYFRSISRARAEWALIEVSVRLVIDEANLIQMAQVAIGGVATVPLLLPHVNEALVGKSATPEIFEQAAQTAVQNSTPLPQTAYKVPLLYGTVLETINRAYNRVWGGEG